MGCGEMKQESEEVDKGIPKCFDWGKTILLELAPNNWVCRGDFHGGK
jgi:hypothetical protein